MWKTNTAKTHYPCPVAESTTVTIENIDEFKQQAFLWANRFRVVCLLDSNEYHAKKYSSKNWLLAIDAIGEINCHSHCFEELEQFKEKAGTAIFGFLTYDLKNELEKLDSNNYDGLHFPNLYFFKPRYVFEIDGNKLTVNRNYPETFELLEAIRKEKIIAPLVNTGLKLTARTPRNSYLQNVEKIRKQIEAGDYYELNYCNEFFATGYEISPAEIFWQLNKTAQAPFSCYFKTDDKYLLCASPERFLKKEGKRLISQPIKGTIKKGNTATEDELQQTKLKHDPKERAENVMIVDLVRNDLARSSKPGTVVVEELCQVYPFNTVNQMISTVVSELETSAIAAIKNAFPMGSMTGAPKIEVMKNIEHYEDFKRGLYSGSVGYFTASDDFDFNVVIRSIFYNSSQKYISVRTGGAITFDSDGEREWNELLLKAKNIFDVLQASMEAN